jgi:hypothetical protein
VAGQRLDDGERIRIVRIGLEELLGWRKGRARIGPDIALYFAGMRHDPALKKRFARELGLD